MVRHLLKKRLMWGMVIAIGIAIAIVGSTLGDSLSAVTAATKPSYITPKPSYTIKNLGNSQGCNVFDYKINNAGQVVGTSLTRNGVCHAFLWDKNKKIHLRSLGAKKSYAFDINNAGKVVGWATDSGNNRKGVLWDINKKIERIITNNGEVNGINDAGQIVGKQFHHAVLWDAEGTLYDLDINNPSDSRAYKINNAGQVVGESNNGMKAVLWDKRKKIELKTLGGHRNSAYGINNEGKVVGTSQTSSGIYRAVLWDKNSITDLGEGTAGSINKAGQVVGTNFGRAILWEKGLTKHLSSMIRSNSGWSLYVATDINDSGQIVGTGIFKGKYHGFLLTPIPAK